LKIKRELIHAIDLIEGLTELKLKYKCNYAVKPTKNKCTFNVSRITCKNCLKLIEKEKYINKINK
jgi:hypothetical protein